MPPNRTTHPSFTHRSNKNSRSSHKATTPCSVLLTDVFAEAKDKYIALEKEIGEISKNISELQLLSDHLRPLSIIADPPMNTTQTDLLAASKFVASIATEVYKRICNARNAIVFNIPDRIPLSEVKRILLDACGMSNHPCVCVRLRKRTQRFNCPLLFEFQHDHSAKEFLMKQSLLSGKTMFKNIKIAPDRTPLERSVYARVPPHGTVPLSRVTSPPSIKTQTSTSPVPIKTACPPTPRRLLTPTTPQPSTSVSISIPETKHEVDLDKSIVSMKLSPSEPPRKRLHISPKISSPRLSPTPSRPKHLLKPNSHSLPLSKSQPILNFRTVPITPNHSLRPSPNLPLPQKPRILPTPTLIQPSSSIAATTTPTTNIFPVLQHAALHPKQPAFPPSFLVNTWPHPLPPSTVAPPFHTIPANYDQMIPRGPYAIPLYPPTLPSAFFNAVPPPPLPNSFCFPYTQFFRT